MKSCLERVKVGDIICYGTPEIKIMSHQVVSIKNGHHGISFKYSGGGWDSLIGLIESYDDREIKNLKVIKVTK